MAAKARHLGRSEWGDAHRRRRREGGPRRSDVDPSVARVLAENLISPHPGAAEGACLRHPRFSSCKIRNRLAQRRQAAFTKQLTSSLLPSSQVAPGTGSQIGRYGEIGEREVPLCNL